MKARPVIGISGTGFIGAGLAAHLQRSDAWQLGPVLTRRDPQLVKHPAAGQLCRDIDTLLRGSDVIVECSGDVLHATEVIEAALAAGKPVVTMNTEFHVTVGSALVGRGLLTEAEGDQPGCLAALHRRLQAAGFRPQVLGNIKGFLNHQPTPEDMAHWAARQGISLAQVTAFTDGTKLQFEQALVANGLGATIARRGLLGPANTDLQAGARELATAARGLGTPISDYVLNPGGPAGVFIVAGHPDRDLLRYLKLGDGPDYFLLQPAHLCHLEIPLTISEALRGESLLDNGRQPSVGVVAVAKTALAPGDRIERALGSFTLRGEAAPFALHHRHPPMGLLQDARVERPIAAGATLTWDDISLPPSRALTLFRQLLVAGQA